ncbi:hypothetical protein ADK41_05760 [Streptomyces caelestis]|uniref:Uncharacterized protein n=1 Tax=Streptomyces caelestis TaxID=36816 RepID=A0A0M9XAP5_9ACTN|nr:hypothetical protein ADK41_05760 [Streptomyces caelestis]
MIFSLMYQGTRKLLWVPAVLLRRQVAKGPELLAPRHENAVPPAPARGPRALRAGGDAYDNVLMESTIGLFKTTDQAPAAEDSTVA